jgi:hypothetical protein
LEVYRQFDKLVNIKKSKKDKKEKKEKNDKKLKKEMKRNLKQLAKTVVMATALKKYYSVSLLALEMEKLQKILRI